MKKIRKNRLFCFGVFIEGDSLCNGCDPILKKECKEITDKRVKERIDRLKKNKSFRKPFKSTSIQG